MRVLVTGHHGYIGSVMVPILQSAGHEVVGLDTFYYEGCDFGRDALAIPEIRKDIRDVAVEDLTGLDGVIHLAALSNDPLGELDPQLTADINYLASVHLAKLAKAAGVARYLYSSSCSLYGAAGDEVLTEEASQNPVTPYGESKIHTEEGVRKLADDKFSPVFMRNATAYGASPRLRADILLNNLVGWAFTTGKVKILSDGTPWRPIVHIRDISAAFLAVLTAPREVIHNESFNVGALGENYQVRDVADIVKDVVPNCEIEYAGKGGPDPRNYRVDFTKITQALPDFKPQWNARRGAEELYEAYKAEGLTLDRFEGRKYVRLKQIRHLLSGNRLDGALRWKS